MTQRLVQFAAANWVRIDGERDVDLLELPFDRFLNAIYDYATRGGTEQERRMFDIRLWMPPLGVVAETGPWSVEAETSAFRAVKAALGAKGAPTPRASP